MKDCFFSSGHRLSRYVTPIVFFAVSILLTSVSVIFLLHESSNGIVEYYFGLVLMIISIPLSVLLVLLGILEYLFNAQQYSLSQAGITIRFDVRSHLKEYFIPWSKIYGVSIILYDEKYGPTCNHPAICVFRKPIPKNFKRRILHSELYGVLQISNFVLIEFSEERLKEFSESYPCEIMDLRPEQTKNYI